jgi:hypothetical protein
LKQIPIAGRYSTVNLDTSTGSLMASLLVSAFGGGFFIYGWKQKRWPQLVVGVVMSIYPFFVESVWLTYLIAVALVVGLWFALRADW